MQPPWANVRSHLSVPELAGSRNDRPRLCQRAHGQDDRRGGGGAAEGGLSGAAPLQASRSPASAIDGVGRRGKYVVVSLDRVEQLVVHLRMTGRLIVQPAGTTDPEPYSNVLLTFTDGTRLCFADVRQFGRMRLAGPEEPWAAEIGLEPLSEEFSFERSRDCWTGGPPLSRCSCSTSAVLRGSATSTRARRSGRRGSVRAARPGRSRDQARAPSP